MVLPPVCEGHGGPHPMVLAKGNVMEIKLTARQKYRCMTTFIWVVGGSACFLALVDMGGLGIMFILMAIALIGGREAAFSVEVRDLDR